MNAIDFSDRIVKKRYIEYFVQLVRIAMTNNILRNAEMKLLYRIGKKWGFSGVEVDYIIETTGKSDYILPYELSKRFEQVYDIVKMTLADGVVDKKEMHIARNFAVKSGFKEHEIQWLLIMLIDGINHDKNHDALFEKYKKGEYIKQQLAV